MNFEDRVFCPSPTNNRRLHGLVQLGPQQCWTWPTLALNGYGTLAPATGKKAVAHRWAWECLVGPVPKGMHLDHMCHDASVCAGGVTCPHRACVNPFHLKPKPKLENELRAANERQTCKRGHLREKFWHVGPDGHGYCKGCQNERRWQKKVVSQ